MKAFREAVCEHFGCSTEDYIRTVFFLCAVQKNKPLLKIAWWIEPDVVVESIKCIEEMADAKALNELDDVFTEYRHALHDMGLANSKFRVSTNSLNELFKRVQGLKTS
jgi:hypothetical protein